LVRHTATAGTDIQLDTYWAVVAVPGATVTWTFSGGVTDSIALAAGGVSDYSGVHTANPIESSSGQQNLSSMNIVAPSVTATVNGSLIIGAFGILGDNAISPPLVSTAMTDVYDHNSAGGPSAENSFIVPVPAGAFGPETATAATAAINIGQLIAVAPGP
jgi:hypothetical protein